MFNSKKHKAKSHQSIDGLINSPHRPSRKIVGRVGSMTPLLTEDPTSRRLDDFNRPSGYHPAQPLVTEQISKREDMPSMINKTLPGEWGETTQDKKPRKGRRNTLRLLFRRAKQAGLVIGIIVIVTTGFLLTKGLINLHKIFGNGSNSLQAIVSPSALHVEGDGRINVLLLGIGGVGHDGPDLTDTMLLASIDSVNHKAALLSVPRDLWVNIPGYGQAKINTAYEQGKWKYLGSESDSNQNPKAVQAGFNLDNQVVGQVLGIPIKYDILVNFQAFQEAVDTLGGVTVNVPTTLYDPTIAWENHNNPVIAQQGLQTFSGPQALLYVRSRETTSDFARTQRQRAVLVAVKDKALSLGTLSNPVKISSLSDDFGNNVVSNLSLSDASNLYNIIKNINDGQIQSIGLADPPNNFVTTGSEDGQSVVRPTAGLYSYSAIQYYVRNTLRDGYLAKENAQITVLNGSTDPSLANNKAYLLKSYGYNVTSVGNAPTQNYKNTVIVDLTGGKDPYTKHYLELRFGLKTVTTLPDNSIQPGNANFVIILGQDETTNS